MSKRVGVFTEAKKQGLSTEEARRYSDLKCKPTTEDLEYERQRYSSTNPGLAEHILEATAKRVMKNKSKNKK